MHSHFIEIGARLSPFLRREFTNPAFELLRHVEVFSNQESLTATPADDVLLIHDLVQKALFRGRSPFTPYEVEKLLIDRFGAPLGLSVCQEQEGISLDYAIPQSLIEAYNTYSDFLMPWNGNIVDVPLDPENPQNERRLLTHLKDAFGDRLLHSLYPQFALSSLLGEEKGKHFLGQHGDFLIALPNGKALILEPGDHDNAAEKMRDDQRDQAMREIRIETVRFRNAQIGEAFVRDEIAPRLEHLGAIPFFQPQAAIPEASVAKQMLFLLPSLLARTEWLLNDALLLRGLFGREKLSVVVIERDLPVLELALLSFLHRIQILEQLYGMQGQALPVVDVTLVRKHSDDFCESLQQELRDVCRFTTVPAIPERSYDLSLDLSVTCNGLTPPEAPVHGLAYAVRNTFPFRQPFALRYRSRPRPIIITDAAESQTAATSFLQDFFRKAAFREGQWPIIRQVLQQKDTIGLLPTSAGKSICFQLASLLTPGTTLVVEPTTALIDDQVQGLQEFYGLDRVIGWHSGAQISPKDVGSVLSGNLIVYVAPERLLRPNFRSAMKDLHAADIFVNYAVADEAHCVSMWGHDFRPSYLNLKYNFTEYCTFQGHKAVVVALTGTASQLVLIDLKTVLEIDNMDAIIRPRSFNRDELHFSLITCKNGEKSTRLGQVLKTVAHRLGVTDVKTQAWGIVFAYRTDELWNYLGEYVGDAAQQVKTVLNAPPGDEIGVGLITGSKPKAAILPDNQWNEYKRRTLAAMKRGNIRLLFGNTAVSVGIDCDRINYIINLRMPQSMESFYQQCGRAGRRAQRSECVLMFSDDDPQGTQRWLSTREPPPRSRWDDIGSVMFFHGESFPRKETDIGGTIQILRIIFARKTVADGRVLVPEVDKHTERYISYALVLGVIDDYAVEGFGDGTVYHVRLHPRTQQILTAGDANAAASHLCDSLHRHLSRYRPQTRVEIDQRMQQAPGASPKEKAVAVLMDFIYERIEQRRVASISTMVAFCNMREPTPEKIRATLSSYFDRSEKFADLLDAMANQRLAVDQVHEVFRRIEGFEDIENVFWETRRVLDEQFRADCGLLNMYAILYRDNTVTEMAMVLWRDGLAELSRFQDEEATQARSLLSMVLSEVLRIGIDLGTGVQMASDLVRELCAVSGLQFVDVVDDINADDAVRAAIRAVFVAMQLGGIVNACRFAQVA